MDERELIVVKYGSSSIVGGEASVEENAQKNIGWYACQLAKLHKKHDVVVVSSGSVALGEVMWPDLVDKEHGKNNQFLAMSGNPYLMSTWINDFRRRGIKAGELLLTHREIADDKAPEAPGSELRAAILRTFSIGGIPIVNENDALSRAELAALEYGGDNDGLASHIARSLGASALFLMTETNGVQNYRARIKQIKACDSSWNMVREYAGGPNENGRGGMETKVEAAIAAAQAGIDAYIAPSQLAAFASIRSGRFGTHFLPVETKA